MGLALIITSLCAIVEFLTLIRITKDFDEVEKLQKATRWNLKEAENKVEYQATQIKERDKLIKDYQEEHELLLSKLEDKDNNIELLVNNLSKQKRELVRPGNQN